MDVRLNAPTSSTRIGRVPTVGRVSDASGRAADVDIVRNRTPGGSDAFERAVCGDVAAGGESVRSRASGDGDARERASYSNDVRSRASGGGDAYGCLTSGRVPTVGRVPLARHVLSIGGAFM